MSEEISGFLNIDKPLRMTSHDVVARARRGLGLKKIGHAGTLDPLASGVLILCVGSATRLSEYVMSSTKQYRARVRLGAITDTYDAEGEVLEQHDASGITREQVEAVLPRFIGAIDQLPPMYSAIKQDGKKLYDLARAGKTVERIPRRVQIDQLTITAWEPPEFDLEVTCGAGTYIRSLAFDIGEALEVGAYLNGLRRTLSGRFTVAEAVSLDSLTTRDEWVAALISPAAAMAGWPVAVVDTAGRLRLQQGGFAPLQQEATNDTLAMVYTDDSQAELLGIVRAVDGVWRPEKIFSR